MKVCTIAIGHWKQNKNRKRLTSGKMTWETNKILVKKCVGFQTKKAHIPLDSLLLAKVASSRKMVRVTRSASPSFLARVGRDSIEVWTQHHVGRHSLGLLMFWLTHEARRSRFREKSSISTFFPTPEFSQIVSSMLCQVKSPWDGATVAITRESIDDQSSNLRETANL